MEQLTKTKLEAYITTFLEESDDNRVSADVALQPELAGMRIFEEAVVGCLSATDPYLISLSDCDAAKLSLSPPSFWLPTAKTVVSVFLRLSARIRKSNAGGNWPSDQWLHGRIEGQACCMALINYLKETLERAGYAAVVPAADERFWVTNVTGADGKRPFSSNWSERHIAHAAGLGTFSLSGGLITPRGMAGRLASLVTSLELPGDTRPYTTFDEYCIMCGECAKRCPVHAISTETGKTHAPCSAFLDKVKETCPPYYGCGKCQSGVPCEDKIPHNAKQSL